MAEDSGSDIGTRNCRGRYSNHRGDRKPSWPSGYLPSRIGKRRSNGCLCFAESGCDNSPGHARAYEKLFGYRARKRPERNGVASAISRQHLCYESAKLAGSLPGFRGGISLIPASVTPSSRPILVISASQKIRVRTASVSYF